MSYLVALSLRPCSVKEVIFLWFFALPKSFLSFCCCYLFFKVFLLVNIAILDILQIKYRSFNIVCRFPSWDLRFTVSFVNGRAHILRFWCRLLLDGLNWQSWLLRLRQNWADKPVLVWYVLASWLWGAHVIIGFVWHHFTLSKNTSHYFFLVFVCYICILNFGRQWLTSWWWLSHVTWQVILIIWLQTLLSFSSQHTIWTSIPLRYLFAYRLRVTRCFCSLVLATAILGQVWSPTILDSRCLS